MRQIKSNETVATLTELLWCDEVADLLCINGFSENGSDFDVFQRICTCIHRAPQTHAAQLCQKRIDRLLGNTVPTDCKQDCHALWRDASQILLTTSITRASFFADDPAVSKSVSAACLPHADQIPATVTVNDLRLSDCTKWSEWSKRAEQVLAKAEEKGMSPELLLPKSFVPTKTSLYHVEQILSGRLTDENLFLTQMLYFILAFSAKKEIRPVISTQGDARSLLEGLRAVEPLTHFPSIVWKPETVPRAEDQMALCRYVMQNRAAQREGEPPVLLASKEDYTS